MPRRLHLSLCSRHDPFPPHRFFLYKKKTLRSPRSSSPLFLLFRAEFDLFERLGFAFRFFFHLLQSNCFGIERKGIWERMGSSGQNNNGRGGGGWLLDYGLVDELSDVSDFIWAPQIVENPTASSVIIGFDVLHKEDSDNYSSRKRARVESCAGPGTKAGREKMRRDRLNDRFTELCSILDPGKPPKADKIAILSDATRLLNQLHLEAEKFKESNEALKDTIKSLKAEKLELRDEKVRLKAEKERMEQMLKGFSVASPFIPQPPPPPPPPAAAAATLHAASFATGGKTIPYTNYLPMYIWQWIPPAALDTSQDHVLRPPVA